MNRTQIMPDPGLLPETVQQLIADATIYDSSCSTEATVWFIDKDGGFYLKSAPAGSLKAEAEMTRFFHGKGLSVEVLAYESADRDYFVTRAAIGEDCIHPQYLDDPKHLSEKLGILLRQLHETDAADCPIATRNSFSLSTAEANYRAGKYDTSLFPASWGFAAKEEAWQEIQHNGHHLQNNALLHGDYCLPNILLDHWKFSGFIDVGFGGLGDRHIDVFWGAWTLFFNLKTNAYYDRFLDAYGRDVLQTELLRTVAAIESFL